MRRTVLAVVLIGLAIVGYLAWPVYTLGRLARAVETRDVATAVRYVHIPSVRQSIAEQVMETYLKLSGKAPASPLLHGIVVSATASLADSVLGDLLDPENFTEFLRTGWPPGVPGASPPGASGLTATNIGSAWQIYSGGKYRFRRFEIAVPPSLPAERRFDLEFRLVQSRWKLTNVRLPQELKMQLAQTLMKIQIGR